jgi:hypothetical protein
MAAEWPSKLSKLVVDRWSVLPALNSTLNFVSKSLRNCLTSSVAKEQVGEAIGSYFDI